MKSHQLANWTLKWALSKTKLIYFWSKQHGRIVNSWSEELNCSLFTAVITLATASDAPLQRSHTNTDIHTNTHKYTQIHTYTLIYTSTNIYATVDMSKIHSGTQIRKGFKGLFYTLLLGLPSNSSTFAYSQNSCLKSTLIWINFFSSTVSANSSICQWMTNITNVVALLHYLMKSLGEFNQCWFSNERWIDEN